MVPHMLNKIKLINRYTTCEIKIYSTAGIDNSAEVKVVIE